MVLLYTHMIWRVGSQKAPDDNTFLPCLSYVQKGLHISRTLLLPESAGFILSAASCLPLKTVELINTGMQEESMPHLISALQRPTAGWGSKLQHRFLEYPAATSHQIMHSLVFSENSGKNCTGSMMPSTGKPSLHVPSQSSFPCPIASQRPVGANWWLTLTDLDLSGNNLGDKALSELIQHMREAKALKRITLKQVGMTDWLAPQVSIILVSKIPEKYLNDPPLHQSLLHYYYACHY